MQYITFRGGCAFITGFVVTLLFWQATLKTLKRLSCVENINMYGHSGLESLHSGKKGTPTMGGVLIIIAVFVSSLLWAKLNDYFVWLAIFVMTGLGALGLQDDLVKIKNGKGLGRRYKLIGQIMVGVILGALLVMNKNVSSSLNFPFFKKAVVELGYFYIFWAALIIVSTSNAVNFTDGLDGLAIGGVIINALLFAVLAYLGGHARFASYLYIPYIKGSGELVVFCLALAGAGLGFLWFNSYPAQIFMGDVGALALGGAIGAAALFIKKEFILFISGGLFVLEALSVIIQMLAIRVFKKRVFRAAPFHHHLQLLGWKEPKIIIRLWIAAVMFAVASLLTLKLR
jgi:phospho-N-acetylmuramoyl-pentapeptide-transferase